MVCISSNDCTVRSCNFEHHFGNRFLGRSVHLADQQTAERFVIEGDFLSLASFDIDRMNGVIRENRSQAWNLR